MMTKGDKQLVQLDLAIEGMTCSSCAKAVEEALKKVEGVENASVNLTRSTAFVEFHPNHVDIDVLKRAVQLAGYDAQLSDQGREHRQHLEEKAHFRLFLTAALLTLPLMGMMLLEMVGWNFPVAPQAFLATVIQFYCGASFYRGSYYALRSLSPNMDVLIMMGTTAAYAFSMAVWLFGWGGHVYFETSAAIITLVLCGRWLESRARRRATSALEMLLERQPQEARVMRDGAFVEIPSNEIVVGDLFQVGPGEAIAVDGEVIQGSSAVDESSLTGEAMPKSKATGSTVFAATINQNGVLVVRATRVGSETVWAGIIKLVDQAQRTKAPVQRLADAAAAVFIPVVVAIALLTLIVWWGFLGQFTAGWMHAVAVLVISCPCALGLAVPTVIAVASGLAAEEGILFREAAALEHAGKLDTIAFDKTGTLTAGRPEVCEVVGGDQVLAIAASLEQQARHPLAMGIIAAAIKRQLRLSPVEDFVSYSGKGIIGKIDGRKYGVCSLAFARELGVKVDIELLKSVERRGYTLCLVFEEDRLLGYLEMADIMRERAKETIDELRALGIKTVLLSGDREQAVKAMASHIGVDQYFAEVFPNGKIACIKKLQESGRVGMVGDGINDAPALAAADVGFAIGAGSDVAIAASDVTLMHSDPLDVVEAVRLSRATLKKVYQNLFFAFVYNVLAIPLAAMGMLNPVVAAGAMAISSLSVVANALLLRRR